MRLFVLFLAVLGVAACDASLGPDQAELRNIKPGNRIPKTSPAQFVRTFDTFCLHTETTRGRLAALLRRADYVPLQPARSGQPQVFVVDDRRPAVVLSDNACSVRARSRTGQATRLQSYIATRFPDATPVDARQFDNGIEQVWSVSTPKPALIATERTTWIDGHTGYAVTLFRLDRWR